MNDELVTHCMEGNLIEVKKLLKEGVDPSTNNNYTISTELRNVDM